MDPQRSVNHGQAGAKEGRNDAVRSGVDIVRGEVRGEARGEAEIVYVALGSNLGDRAATFSDVIRAIESESGLELRGASPVFETEPVGPGEQRPYLNAVVRLETAWTPIELLDYLQGVERSLGRDRRRDEVRWGPRIIDLDILFFGSRCIDSSRLVVPHPLAHERAFVLGPMAALAPDFEHPKLGVSIQTLESELPKRELRRCANTPEGWPN